MEDYLKSAILELAENYDSFYVYEKNSIIERTNRLKELFPEVDFLYSVKSNHHSEVIKTVFSQGFGADAASFGEVQLALDNRLGRDEIFFSAPGKSAKDIRNSIGKVNLIADSIGEIDLINEIASDMGVVETIGVRINPDFSFYGGKGTPSKFGIDEEALFEYEKENKHPNVKINGIHVHLKSQELDYNRLAEYHGNVMKLAERIEKVVGTNLEYINFGSGIGLPYSHDDSEMNVFSLSENFNKLIKDCNKRIMIEVGRYAVGKSGHYVTKVMDRKISRGKTYIILKNTLNGFARPSFAVFTEKYSSDDKPAAYEPLYTGKDSFDFVALKDGNNEKVDLVGNLCTSADIIAEDIIMPRLERGDLVVINNAGAYAAVLSPQQFASQEKPTEVLI